MVPSSGDDALVRAEEIAPYLHPVSAKARAALGEYRLQRLESPSDPAFEEAFGALWSEFAPRGEIERRPIVERWLRKEGSCAYRWNYHLLVARAPGGESRGTSSSPCRVATRR